jgi:hypothetical protein
MFALHRYTTEYVRVGARPHTTIWFGVTAALAFLAASAVGQNLSIQVFSTPSAIPCSVPATDVTQCVTSPADQVVILDVVLANNGTGSASSPHITISVFHSVPGQGITPAELSASVIAPPGYSCTGSVFGTLEMVIFCSGDPTTTLQPGATAHFVTSAIFHSPTSQPYIVFTQTNPPSIDGFTFTGVLVTAAIPTLTPKLLALLMLFLGVVGYVVQRS